MECASNQLTPMCVQRLITAFKPVTEMFISSSSGGASDKKLQLSHTLSTEMLPKVSEKTIFEKTDKLLE